MNRLYIAIALLVVASGLCGYEMMTIKQITDDYCNILNTISDTAEIKGRNEALRLSENMLESWEKKSKELDKFVYHDYVDNISVSLSDVPLYVKSADIEETRSYIQAIKIQLASLNESELPYMHNIF